MPDTKQDEIALVTRYSWALIAFLAVVLILVAWLTWPGPTPPEPPRAREYRDFDICLLTDRQGIQGSPASEVWQGLQPVSVETASRVTFLAVSGEQTTEVATQFVATQVQQQCDIIVAVGEPAATAAASSAGRYPQVKFVVVGGRGTAPNVFPADAAATPEKVRSLIG